MAGHSKWANIKHRKAVQDSKRGKIFTKLIRELTVATREGGSDVNSNSRLRLAVDKALSNNMKRETIDKAMMRGSGQFEGQNFKNVRYEGYGPSGIAIMIDCLTDNSQRTTADVRHVLSKNNGNLGIDGSVSYLFESKGVFLVTTDLNEDQLLDICMENGAEEIDTMPNETTEIICAIENFQRIKKALTDHNVTIKSNENTHIASTQTELDLTSTQKILNLIDQLEDLDDVQQVYSNLAINEEILVQL